MLKFMKKNKKSRLQNKEKQIIIRNDIIKALIAIIVKNKIDIPVRLYDLIKNTFNLNNIDKKLENG
jgi:hypothetical protein